VILTDNEQNDTTMKMLPYQNALLETFFDPASKRVILLRGDVGTGKSAALAALVGRLLREKQMARILFLVPATLRLQFIDMLHNRDCPAMIVDRYRFREMLDASAENDFWPKGVALILSIDFAKQTDIQDSLSTTYWDLVIIDEAHIFRSGARLDALRKIASSADRIIMATVIPLELPNIFPIDDTAIVVWKRTQLIDLDGKPLDIGMCPVLNEVPFNLSTAELHLRSTMNDLCGILGKAIPQQNFRTMRFIRALESSPAALEVNLQRYRNQLKEREEVFRKLLKALDDVEIDEISLEDSESVTEEEVRASVEAPVDLVMKEVLLEDLDSATKEEAIRIAERALKEIDELTYDSKFYAFNKLLNQLYDGEYRWICVFTQFVSTLYYLAAEIEDRGMEYLILHGGMSSEDRQLQSSLFKTSEKILLTTSAGIEFFELAYATDLILYDIPTKEIQQLLGRFNRTGRKKPLNIHALTPSDSTGVLITEPLTMLREFITMGPNND